MMKKGIVNKALIFGLSATLVAGQAPAVALAQETLGEANVDTETVQGTDASDEEPIGGELEQSESDGATGGDDTAEGADVADDDVVVTPEDTDAPEIEGDVDTEVQAPVEDEAPSSIKEPSVDSELSGNASVEPTVEAEPGPVESAREVIAAENANGALAEEAAGEPVFEQFTFEDELGLTDEELFAGYVEQTLYEPIYGDIATFGNFGETHLNTLEKFYYHKLKGLVERVAAGEQELAVIEIPISQCSAAELGKPYSQLTASEVGAALKKVFHVLLIDCPYDLYWFDKTIGVSGGYQDKSGRLLGTTVLGFEVLDAYRAQVSGEYASWTTDTTKTKAASQTVSRAQSVVSQYASLADYEKIVAYKNWICDQVSYDRTASSTPGYYGDPWQVISVFDNNPNTNVVCEGYAKAFQYLCDLSTFASSSTQSYIVDGDMSGEAHMWNVVTLLGATGTANYLVDLTNTDGGKTGVFLNGAVGGSIADGYTFKHSTAGTLVYRCDADQKALYGTDASSILNLSLADYVAQTTNPSNPTNPTPGGDQKVPETLTSKNAANVNLVYGYATSSTPTLTVQASNHTSKPRYQWYCNNKAISGATAATYKIPGKLHSGTYSYYCQVTWPGTSEVAGTTKDSAITKVAVQKRKLTIVPTSGLYKYTTEADPQFTYTLGKTTLVSGDKLTGSLSRKAGNTPGTYAITLGTLRHNDYELTLVGNVTFEVRSPWVKQGNAWKYALPSGGYATGWVQEGSTWYYCDNQGKMQTGWLQKGSTWYYFNGSGAMVTGWKSIGGTWYYFNTSGAMKTGWLDLNGTWYYFSGSGAMKTGWQVIGGAWYYFNGSGVMATGWKSIGGTWYYFNASGSMATGWKQIGNSWYYFNGSGVMLTGWQSIGGTWYYFYGSGAMASNTTVGGYKLSASGAMV